MLILWNINVWVYGFSIVWTYLNSKGEEKMSRNKDWNTMDIWVEDDLSGLASRVFRQRLVGRFHIWSGANEFAVKRRSIQNFKNAKIRQRWPDALKYEEWIILTVRLWYNRVNPEGTSRK